MVSTTAIPKRMWSRLFAVSVYWVPHEFATFYHILGKQIVGSGSVDAYCSFEQVPHACGAEIHDRGT